MLNNSLENLTLYQFGAEWCVPCTQMSNNLKKVVPEFNNINVVHIDVEEETDLAREYNVRSIPTLVLMKNGKVVDRLIGSVPIDRLREFLKK
jgi:thioredoxin